MAKINFTKEHFSKMCNLAMGMLLDNGVNQYQDGSVPQYCGAYPHNKYQYTQAKISGLVFVKTDFEKLEFQDE